MVMSSWAEGGGGILSDSSYLNPGTLGFLLGFDWLFWILLWRHWGCVGWLYGVDCSHYRLWFWLAVADLCYWGVGFWIGFGVWAVDTHENITIIGESEFCICMAVCIHIVVPSGVDTPDEWVIELHFVWVCRLTYSNSCQVFGLRIRSSYADIPFMVKVTDRGDWELVAWIKFDSLDKLVCSHEVEGQISWAYVEFTSGVGYGIVPVLSGIFSLCEVIVTHFQ